MSRELAVMGADTANQQAGGGSFLDNATMFTSTAVASGIASIYNTFVDYGNALGGDFENIDVGKQLETYDRDWYQYYKDNQQLIDTAGFVGTSFLPGTLAIKGLKAAQAARGTGAIGRAVSGSLNFFNAKRDASLAAGLEEIGREGGSAYAYINANKLSAIGWGFAEQTLQAGAFEAGVALTMKDSPLLADKSTKEVFNDMAYGMFVGGAFGGAIDTILTNRVFKDAVKAVATKQRGYDTPAYYSNLGLHVGDEAYGFVDSLLSLPKEVLDSDKFAKITSVLNKKDYTLDLENLLKQKLSDSERAMFNQMQLTLQKLGTQSTPEVGQSAANWAVRTISDMRAAGKDPAEIKQTVGDMLLGMKKGRVLTDDTIEPFKNDDLFYLSHEVDLGKLAAEGNSVEKLLELARSRTPFAKNATSKPYEVIGDVANAKVVFTAPTFEAAWKDGYDLAVVAGKMRINPKSEIFQQVKDPNLIPQRYVNFRTGGVSDEVVPTWADMLPAGAKPADSIVENGVLNGKKVLAVANDTDPNDALTATARHAWASTLKPDSFSGATVDVRDISRMERLSSLSRDELQRLGTKIEDTEGGVSNASDVDLKRLLLEQKLQKTQDMLDAGVTDHREITYVTNTTEDWFARALANGFKRTAEDNLEEGMSRELSDYLQRENFLVSWESPRSLVELGAVDAETLKATEAAASSKGAKYVDTFVTGQLGFQQRVALLTQQANNAFHSVFGSEEAGKFMDVSIENARKMADELGVGAGALSFSNANYGDQLRMWAQYTGAKVHQLIQKTAEANLERMQPFISKFQDNKIAGAELGVILNMLRRSSNKFVLAFENTAQSTERLVVREVTKIDMATGQRIVDSEKLAAWLKEHSNTGRNGAAEQAVFQIEQPEVLDFLKSWRDINGGRINKRAVLMNARGATLGWDPDVIYAPPINTQKYPYFAFVKVKQGHIASSSDVGMLTAKTPEELSKLEKEIDRDKYDVFFKSNTAEYFRVKQEYDSQLAMNESRVDSSLRKEGKLGDFFYEVRPESVMEDFITYSQNADAALVRHGVELRYAQLITELNALGKKYTEIATSQTSGLSKLYDRSVVNPFGDYVLTALDISKRSSFPLLNQLNEFVDNLGTTAYRVLVANGERASKGLISWQEAERIATKYGVGGVFNADNVETAFHVANRPMDRNLLRETVSKANMALATLGLRLDFANSLVNIISLPIMLGTELSSLKTLAAKDPSAIGALRSVFSTSPDGQTLVPSYTKLIGQAIQNVIGKDGKKLIEQYRASGDVKDVMLQYYDMLDQLAIKPATGLKSWRAAVDAFVEKGSKWTGNQWAEDFTRALSANVMDQLTAPLIAKNLLTSQEAAAYRSVFVNRVNGNYISSQRPILFQGTVGAAVSLFQTYIFNVMQQMTRHIENRDMRALLTMTGLQGAIYGLNGLPFFEAANTHLVGNANINDGHRDVYSMVTQLAGKGLGEWMLYGTASAFPLFGDKAPALYTRGDINPRHVSILPVSPADIPAVSVSTRVVQNLLDIGSKISNGGALGASLLEGLEHNGVSRPLAGFAQLAQGYTTTSKGALVSASNDLDLVVAATRILGAKPMDESVALNTMFRQNAYKAADLDRLNKLGEAVKTKLRKNQMPSDEEMQGFMKAYASAGGNLQRYSEAIQRWSRDANMSVVNQMKNFHNTPYAQRLSEIMSGVNLEDYQMVAPPATQP